jgi:hypothetical protein
MSKHMSRRSALTAGAEVAAGAAIAAVGVAAAGIAAAGIATAEPSSDAAAEPSGTAEPLSDPLAAITGMAVRFDLKQWDRLVEVFATKVRIDYTGLVGGEPATVRGADLVGDWRRNLGHLTATQHLLANQVVRAGRGADATATADFQAVHRLGPLVGGRLYVLGGRYEYRLVRVGRDWRISGVTMQPVWESGDRTVIGLPAA